MLMFPSNLEAHVPPSVPRPVASNQPLLRRVTALLPALLLAASLACSCSKAPEPPPPPPTPVPTPRPTPTPKPTPTRTPIPTPTPDPTPTPIVHHYAPEGTFYVTQDITVRMPGGLVGVTAGTQVKQLKDNGETLQVSDGHDQFDIKKTQMTNDLDVAAVILKRAQAAQAATDLYQSQQDAIRVRQEQAELEFLKTHPLATAPPTPAH